MELSAKDYMVCSSAGAIRDTLKCLFFHGPTWDGNVPSKSARDALCTLGLAHHEFGLAFLTREGVEMCINLELDRAKEAWERRGRPPYLGFKSL